MTRPAARSAHRGGAFGRPSPGYFNTKVSDVLGLDHPLTRACARVDATRRQLLLVAAILAGSLLAALDGSTIAPAVAIAAALVLAGFAAAAFIRTQARRDCVLDLILEGRENLPVELVQRQRLRLASPRVRRALAATLQAMVEEILRPPRLGLRTVRPLLFRAVIIETLPDLERVISRLRGPDATVRGVAFTERLITHGESALYGDDSAALRDQLRRARVLLELG